MKKIIAITLLCLTQFDIVYGQVISEKEARELLEEAYRCLQTDDTLSFLKLWMPDSSAEKETEKIISKQDIIKSFHRMKEMLDPPLLQNLKIDHISIQKYDPKYPDTKHDIYAYFKGHMCDGLAFGLLVVYHEGKWIARGYPHVAFPMNK